MDEASLEDIRGRGAAEYRNQPGGDKLIFGTFACAQEDGERLRALAEARAPLRFEGVARDHARRYRVVVTVFVFRFDGQRTVFFRATGAPEVYSPIRAE